MCKIYLESGPFGWDYVIKNTVDDRYVLIQTDWDYPGIASTFGWIPCEQCSCTDGTVDCEHKTVDQMIDEAQEYIDSEVADLSDVQVDDPGYFDREGS